MPIITCTSCGRKLNVKEEALGKRVRCPGCQQVFTAEETVELEELPEEAEPPRPAPGSRAIASTPPPPRRRPVEDEDEDLDDRPRRRRPAEDEDEDFDDRPRRRKKRKARSSDVDALVHTPATALQIVGYVGIALGILGVILNIVGAGAVAQGPGGGGAAYRLGSAAGAALITALWCGFVIQGANAMSSRSSYGTALAGCIVAMLPCNLACLGGLPIGIWGLVILCNADVKNSFR